MTEHNLPRLLLPQIHEALQDTPVVLVNGPRQSGKTTLVQQFADAQRPYFTLDDAATLAAVRHDPVGFVYRLDLAVLDEVQRVPELLLAIKQQVDKDRRPGRFLLTGSANVMTLPRVADSLAGRIETHKLLPLAGAEIEGKTGQWLDAVFEAELPQALSEQAGAALAENGPTLVERVLRGGYPQALARATDRRRHAWHQAYIDTLMQRDVRDIAAIEKLSLLPKLLQALAHMAGQLCNFAQLAGHIGLDSKTAEKYLSILEHMFLLRRIPQWSGNGLARIVKSPKIHFLDTGLLASLMGINSAWLERQRHQLGPLVESYVCAELIKMSTWSQQPYQLYTFRTLSQTEVDFVIENPRGDIIGIEVKASASFKASDFTGLKRLAELAGERFKSGLLLYDGSHTLPMGQAGSAPLTAVPLSTLWQI